MKSQHPGPNGADSTDAYPLDYLLKTVRLHHPLLLGTACDILMEIIIDRWLLFEQPQINSRLTNGELRILDRCLSAFRAEAIDLIDRALVYGWRHSTLAHTAAVILAVVFRYRFPGDLYFGPDEVACGVVAKALVAPLGDLVGGEANEVVRERVIGTIFSITPATLGKASLDFHRERIDLRLNGHDIEFHAGFVWPPEPSTCLPIQASSECRDDSGGE